MGDLEHKGFEIYKIDEPDPNGVKFNAVIIPRGVWNIMPEQLKNDVKEWCGHVGISHEKGLGYQIPLYTVNSDAKNNIDNYQNFWRKVNAVMDHFNSLNNAQKLWAGLGKMDPVELEEDRNGTPQVARMY